MTRLSARQRSVLDAEKFERKYAENSGLTVERLRELGRIVATCDCGDPECEGFQMIAPDLLESYREMGRPWVQVLPEVVW